jgi:hypothetical protein
MSRTSPIEDQVRRAMALKADTIVVDADACWRDLQTRLPSTSRPRPSASRWRGRLVLAGAAASLLCGLVVLLPHVRTGFTSPAPQGPVRASIGDAWACSHRTTYAVEPSIGGSTTKAWLSGYESDLQWNAPTREAVDFDVARYEFVDSGTRPVLIYADADGLITSRSVLKPAGDGWRVAQRTLCSGRHGSPSPGFGNSQELASHATPLAAPQPASWNSQEDAAAMVGTPTLLDARTYYDQTGQLRRQSTYAVQTDACDDADTSCALLVTLSQGSAENGAEVIGSDGLSCGALARVTYHPLGVADAGRQLCSVWVPDGKARNGVQVVAAHGVRTSLQRFHAHDWSGSLYAAALTKQELRGSRLEYLD